jgi:uncharacterized membrane protein
MKVELENDIVPRPEVWVNLNDLPHLIWAFSSPYVLMGKNSMYAYYAPLLEVSSLIQWRVINNNCKVTPVKFKEAYRLDSVEKLIFTLDEDFISRYSS